MRGFKIRRVSINTHTHKIKTSGKYKKPLKGNQEFEVVSPLNELSHFELTVQGLRARVPKVTCNIQSKVLQRVK